ncbi:MAG: N-6 DNA methylase [Bacteroidales bacterium]|nr:N-6 DNA methylase [Bacteroidales bacterium]
MITTDIFQNVLECLGFEKQGDIFKKDFPNLGTCTMSADFKNKQLNYPENLGFTINDRTTCNFEHPENFVVFECVHRLLEKGYRPEHIELEKRWNLGHDAKGGKADICVYNQDRSQMLLIIECKTAGGEHSKAFKLLKEDGGQLFSYWQQERSTKWLSLYASDYKDSELTFENYVIDCSDDENVKKLAAKDKSIKLYEKAQTVKDLFDVWDETYDKIIFEKGVVFGEESQAYQIGVSPLRKKNLEDFKPEDKIVNRFEEILRHNNVSDKENAFNRLVALFICKLVDETQKTDNDVVEFQYKTGTDTYESLQDRLQRLHKEGMEKFMGEEIFYVSDDYAENLFAQKFNDTKRKAAIEDLKNTIRILKFYSNNDFAFKDVHNEELFFQNGKILVEVVQLFQKYRIVYPSKHQFLGDLFEQLLNKGFKQNEGQFFTPTPITRFIWDCLPMEKIVRKGENFYFPKVIDYACGAGHFLTEAVEAINAYFTANDNTDAIHENAWCEHHIYGVEKDYRLARVAKVSLYMNGAGQGNIKFGDGLEQYEEEKICNYSFDVLVANPPYSVSGFKAHLKLKNNRFELLERNLISNDGSEIETLFVERIAQLLKPKGIAAVVLPSSILSNDSNSYMTAREILLQNFYLRAVAQFGSKTFGATGTNTVVLYLEKYNEPPKKREIVKDIVNAILSGNFADDWEDADVFKKYVEKINVPVDLYKAFAAETATKEELAGNEYFAQYINWFDNLTEVVNKRKSAKFSRMTEDEQKAEIKDLFYKTVKSVEYEKLMYFTLVYNQSTLTIIAPADNAEQKKFLGYDWSNRKGAEGIQINQPGGMLYNDQDRYAVDTLAAAVRFTFDNRQITLSESISNYYAYLHTADMIDFSRTSFNKAIKLTTDKKIEIVSKFPLVKLGGEDGVCNILIGGTPSRKNAAYYTGNNLWVSIAEMRGQVITDTKEKITDEGVKNSNVKLIPKGTTLLSFKLSIGKTAIAGADLYTNEAIAALIPKNKEQITDQYLFSLFNGKMIDLENVGNKAFGKSLNSAYLNNEVKIPLPPIDIQQQIVSECEKVDDEYNNSRMTIEEYKKKIEEVFEHLDVISKRGGVAYRLSNSYAFEISIGKRVLNTEVKPNFTIPVYSANVFEPFGMIDKLLIEDFSKDSVIWGIDGDWMVNVIPANTPFYPTDHCGVLRIKTDDILPKYMAHLLKIEGQKAGFKRSYRASIDRIESLSVQIAPIEEQRKAISEIENYEQKISEAKVVMDGCAERKKQILEKWLR